MSKYITIDGRSYYSPCSECKDGYCSSCIIHKYQEDLNAERDRRTSAEWRIERELEPRIKAEERAYDFWLAEDTGAVACESFSQLIGEMIDFVEDNDKYMEWDSPCGDLEEMILYLIRNRNNGIPLYIKECASFLDDGVQSN